MLFSSRGDVASSFLLLLVLVEMVELDTVVGEVLVVDRVVVLLDTEEEVSVVSIILVAAVVSVVDAVVDAVVDRVVVVLLDGRKLWISLGSIVILLISCFIGIGSIFWDSGTWVVVVWVLIAGFIVLSFFGDSGSLVVVSWVVLLSLVLDVASDVVCFTFVGSVTVASIIGCLIGVPWVVDNLTFGSSSCVSVDVWKKKL